MISDMDPVLQPLLRSSGVITSRDAHVFGLDELLRSEVARGTLAPIRRGVYADKESFARAGASARYRTAVIAAMSVRKAPVATGASAAVLLGLPIIGDWPSEVTLLSPTASGRRRNGVVELGRRGDEGVIERDGIVMTDIPRTLIEACRQLPYLAALAMVDAALHRDRRSRIPPLVEMNELRDQFERMLPISRSRRIEHVLATATTQADTPFETLSRVVIHDEGFPEPELQYPILLPQSNRLAYLDFAWPKYRIWGEADGRGKYLSGDHGDGRSAAHSVIAEKNRENGIRAMDWRPARWEWMDAWERYRLRRILLEAGLPIVRKPRRYV